MSQPTRTKTPHILAILPAVIPTATIYILRPLQAMAERGEIHFTFITEEKSTLRQIHSCDLIVFCRNDNSDFLGNLQEALRWGIPTVYDIDDNFWELPENLWIGKYYRAGRRLETIETYLRNVTLVRAFSKRLQERVSALYNHSVELTTPCIDLSLMPTEPAPRRDQAIHLVYATSKTYADPLCQLFLPALQNLLAAYPEQLQAHFYGGVPSELLRYPNARWQPVDYEYASYLANLGAAGFDIGLAPLMNHPFYNSKTDTKFRDYGAAWITGIYSETETYASVQHQVTGLKVRGSDEWENAILLLMNSPVLQASIRLKAHDYVTENYRQQLMENNWRNLCQRLIPSPNLPRRLIFSLSSHDRGEINMNSIAPGFSSLSDQEQIKTLMENISMLREELQEQEVISLQRSGERDQALFAFDSMQKDYREQASRVESLLQKLDEMEAKAQELSRNCEIYENQISSLEKELASLIAENNELLQKMETAHLSSISQQLQQTIEEQGKQIQEILIRKEREKHMSIRAAAELDQFRKRKVIRWITRLFDRSSLADVLGPAYANMIDDSKTINPSLKGYVLQPGENLQGVPFIAYRLNVARAGLSLIEIAPILDCLHSEGQVGIELISPIGKIIFQVSVPASEALENQPLKLHFAPLPSSPGLYELRVFARELQSPLRIFEWRRYSLGGFGKISRLPFIGIGFNNLEG